MRKEEFWAKLDAAVSNRNQSIRNGEMLKLLRQGYEENLELLCECFDSPQRPGYYSNGNND